ncbi:DUF211 domain-containing protein [Vulcanisaeta distributa]|uniref:Uncharacterized protein n=1 Tax=Vulcanisaeta distributa (strain DSM 14429 / JCM 11212 / NBRC 100878 / IC-017) TaxID=572478 RepID=E1QUZ1_VULDI|nr:DUF211 domain-containing protein [Vulcanisaeta distributa]ADN51182.1 protein of unknown function DUF211 [Vulcanisaeta distributa DSM 14429]
MGGLRRVVLDVDIPSSVSTVELADRLGRVSGVKAVNVTVTDTDVEVLGLVIVIEGDNINYDDVKRVIEDLGGAIRSIDQVIVGEYILELNPQLLKER